MQLLPDLTPLLTDTDSNIFSWSVHGNELRLTTTLANIGEGALEIRGGDTTGDVQDVIQRIFDSDGSYEDRLAGEFRYHSNHGHTHFEDFAEFRLLEVLPDGGVGDVVSTADKVSFCLIDVERLDSSGSSNYHSCGQVQGISAGWADIYDSGLPGQALDIAGVQNGSYWLEIEVDPQNRLVEADETNNIARVRIELDRDGAVVPPSADLYENNDSFETASILAPPEDHLYENLSIHASDNDDYYRVTASADGTLSFNLAFDDDLGDLDMRVFDASRSQIAISQSTSNNEQVNVEALTGEQFFVQVYGYNGATNSDYSLLVDQAEPLVPIDEDEFESNDSFESASILAAAEDQFFENLSIHAPDNDDHYRVTASADGTLSFNLTFDHGLGDLDMRVFDASQTQLAISDSTSNSEQVNVEALTDEQFFVQVFGYNGATNSDYSLLVDQAEPLVPIAEDEFESNDSFETASILAAPEDQLYENLSVHAPDNDDYYGVTASADGTLSFNLSFDHSLGDVDLRVFDASQSQLATSTSTSNSEQVNVEALTGEQFFVQVYGYNGATNSDYSLLVDQAEPAVPVVEDEFESNDSFETASILVAAEDQLYENLSIHAPDNDDYYRVTASEDGTLSFNLAFDHSLGDVDMRVFDASQVQLATSTSTNNSEQVSVEALTGEEFFVQVYGYNGATNSDYSLLVDQAEPFVPPVDDGSTIFGTSGNDYIDGTDGDDIINGLTGNDVIFASSGNDTISGGVSGYDQVDYSGSPNDYDFVRNEDGTFSVTDLDGSTDLLSDIDGIWFNGSSEWFDIDELA